MQIDINEGAIIPIDKPYAMTSFGALARVRGMLSRHLRLKRVKIGHAGTLDPLATGVLLLCTGKATKKIELLQQQTKEYVAIIQIGATTPSYDREHEVDAVYPTDGVSLEAIRSVLAERFTGTISQVPPTYSACKVGGQRAYDMMRKGREVELVAKTVTIYDNEVLHFRPESMQLTLRVVCGKGTYIRSLARDLGQALHSGAYLYDLRRTRIGQYRADDCIKMDAVQAWLEANVTRPDSTVIA